MSDTSRNHDHAPDPMADPAKVFGPPVADLASRLRLASTRLVRRLRQESATGLPLSSLSALAVIGLRGPISLGALAEVEGVTPPTLTRVARRLEDEGLIDRMTDDDDKRVKYVEITESGRALLARSRERRNAWLADRLAMLDTDDLAAMERVVALLDTFVSDTSAPAETAVRTDTPLRADEGHAPVQAETSAPADRADGAVEADTLVQADGGDAPANDANRTTASAVAR